jgi:hypothetical protein
MRFKYNQLQSEQITVNLHDAFMIAAMKIAQEERKYLDLHKAHGIEQSHWELITQKEYWTVDQARAVRSILANVVEVSMTIAGMPPTPLPGQYVAAVIATVVAPCNRIIACMKAPDTFDALDASGLISHAGEEVKVMTPQQLISLTMAYAGGYKGEPISERLPKQVAETVMLANKNTKVKKA